MGKSFLELEIEEQEKKEESERVAATQKKEAENPKISILRSQFEHAFHNWFRHAITKKFSTLSRKTDIYVNVISGKICAGFDFRGVRWYLHCGCCDFMVKPCYFSKSNEIDLTPDDCECLGSTDWYLSPYNPCNTGQVIVQTKDEEDLSDKVILALRGGTESTA